MRPNFLIPGAGKGGTNSIRSYLREHPDVFFCRAKEPNYFAHAFDLGPEWYAGLFAKVKTEKILGEASTHYFWYPDAAKRIHDYNPDFRLLFTLRNPIRRAFSDYTAEVSRAGQTRPFREVVHRDSQIIKHSEYFTNISRFLEYFPRDQIHILLFEQFVDNPHQALRTLCGFLDIDDTHHFSTSIRRENISQAPLSYRLQRLRTKFSANNHDNSAKFYLKGAIRKGIDRINHIVDVRHLPVLTDDDSSYLYGMLAAEIDGLEKLLDIDLTDWRTTAVSQS